MPGLTAKFNIIFHYTGEQFTWKISTGKRLLRDSPTTDINALRGKRLLRDGKRLTGKRQERQSSIDPPNLTSGELSFNLTQSHNGCIFTQSHSILPNLILGDISPNFTQILLIAPNLTFGVISFHFTNSHLGCNLTKSHSISSISPWVQFHSISPNLSMSIILPNFIEYNQLQLEFNFLIIVCYFTQSQPSAPSVQFHPISLSRKQSHLISPRVQLMFITSNLLTLGAISLNFI